MFVCINVLNDIMWYSIRSFRLQTCFVATKRREKISAKKFSHAQLQNWRGHFIFKFVFNAHTVCSGWGKLVLHLAATSSPTWYGRWLQTHALWQQNVEKKYQQKKILSHAASKLTRAFYFQCFTFWCGGVFLMRARTRNIIVFFFRPYQSRKIYSELSALKPLMVPWQCGLTLQVV